MTPSAPGEPVTIGAADVTVTSCAFVDSCNDQHDMSRIHVTATTTAAGPRALIDGIESPIH